MKRTLIMITRIGAVLTGLVELPLTALILYLAWEVLKDWMSIGNSFRVVGIIFLVTGLVAMIASLWSLVSLGRKLFPISIAGSATSIAGATLFAGVATHVIPCGGPD